MIKKIFLSFQGSQFIKIRNFRNYEEMVNVRKKRRSFLKFAQNFDLGTIHRPYNALLVKI